MTPNGLAWFRTRQRTLARSVLALFCLTWLQLAALPCVMASSIPGAATASMAAADPAVAHDCIYCPPEAPEYAPGDGHAACGYPHDPQVDARASVAFGMALPTVAPLLTLPLVERPDDITALIAPPLTVPRAPFAVSYCRFLK